MKIIITELLGKEGHLLKDVVCADWEELVDIIAAPLISEKVVEPRFVESAKDAVRQFGGYVVLIDDIAIFHGKPEDGVHELALTLALLKRPVYLAEKRITAAFLLAAVDNKSHRGLIKEMSLFFNNDKSLEILRKGEDVDAIFNEFKEVEGLQT